jgi:hypothetical protein
MTDYVGHAAEYAGDSGRIDAFVLNPGDVLYYDDRRFDEMRHAYRRLSDQQLLATYNASLVGNRFADTQNFGVVKKLLRSDTRYSNISGDPTRNDALVPLLQKYAREAHGKNIIAFHGNDYADYGGQTEYVVGDVLKLTDLRKLYTAVRSGSAPVVENAQGKGINSHMRLRDIFPKRSVAVSEGKTKSVRFAVVENARGKVDEGLFDRLFKKPIDPEAERRAKHDAFLAMLPKIQDSSIYREMTRATCRLDDARTQDEADAIEAHIATLADDLAAELGLDEEMKQAVLAGL